MNDFFANLSLVFCLLSPMFAYRADFKRLGHVNLVTVLLFLLFWGYVLTTGAMYNSPASIIFYALLVINLFFAMINSALFMRVRHPRPSLFKLLGMGALLIVACVFFIEYLHPTNVNFDTLMQALMTAVPIFVTGIIFIRLKQIDREPEL